MTSQSKALMRAVVGTEHDFEWYPTTDEIIKCVEKEIKNHYDKPSMLDCGAGDGRVLHALAGKKYAIEKSRPLIDSMAKDVFILGTEFHQQSLIDKKVQVVFSNPVFSEYAVWATKIIREANCEQIYLVLPQRWKTNSDILEAIELREVKAKVIGTFDFSNAERQARVRIDVVKIDNGNERFGMYDRGMVDAFSVWFDQHFAVGCDSSEEAAAVRSKAAETPKICSDRAIVEGHNLVESLVALYNIKFKSMLDLYMSLSSVDSDVLCELGVELKQVRESLQNRIDGLKTVFWSELLDNLSTLTRRLTNTTRQWIFEKFADCNSVDFTIDNIYSVVGWLVKQADTSIEEQLISTYEKMIEKANVVLYKSNKKVIADNTWRWREARESLTHYKLEYRIILQGYYGLVKASSWRGGYRGCSLTESGCHYLNDLCVVASTLGFDTTTTCKAEERVWESNKQQVFSYFNNCTDQHETLMVVRAYYNGNLHIKFNKAFMLKLNIEMARLKGWVRDSRDVSSEFEVSVSEAEEMMHSIIRIGRSDLKLISFSE